jgi:hypothetical protein
MLMNNETNFMHALCRHGGCVEEIRFLGWSKVFCRLFKAALSRSSKHAISIMHKSRG